MDFADGLCVNQTASECLKSALSFCPIAVTAIDMRCLWDCDFYGRHGSGSGLPDNVDSAWELCKVGHRGGLK